MGLINTIRERHAAKREQEIDRQARYEITVRDFDGRLYIAYSGTPLFLINEDWTTKEIIEHLEKVRANFIKSKQDVVL